MESVKRPDQEEDAVKLLQGIGWVGVGMVEYRRDSRDGVAKVIEINERINASTRLSCLAGVPLPEIIYEVYVQGTATPALDYKAGLRSRWLIPGDILHFLFNPNRWKLKPSFFDFRDPNTYYEFQDRRDWRPLLFWILWMAAHSLDLTQWRDFIFRKWSTRK